MSCKGIIIRECSVWSLNIVNCDGVRVDNAKVIGHYVNNDGIVIGGTSNAVVERCFSHNADDSLEIKVESRKIRPKYADVPTVMKTLAMRGLANVWQISETTTQAAWKEENKQLTSTAKSMSYVEAGLMPGATAPLPPPPKIPYVYELASSDPFDMPKVYGGNQAVNQPLVDFRVQPSTGGPRGGRDPAHAR